MLHPAYLGGTLRTVREACDYIARWISGGKRGSGDWRESVLEIGSGLARARDGRHACSLTFAAHCGYRWLPLRMGTRRRSWGDWSRQRAGRAANLEAYRPLQREWAAGKARQDSPQAFGGGFHVQDRC